MRLSVGAGGSVVVGQPSGRGAWLCRGSTTCWDLAQRRGAVARALRTEIDDSNAERVREALLRTGTPGGATPQVCEDGTPGRPTGARPHEGQGT